MVYRTRSRTVESRAMVQKLLNKNKKREDQMAQNMKKAQMEMVAARKKELAAEARMKEIRKQQREARKRLNQSLNKAVTRSATRAAAK